MKIICIDEYYECGSNADGTPMVCHDRYCFPASDDYDPLGARVADEKRKRFGSVLEVLEESVKLLAAWGFDVAVSSKQLADASMRKVIEERSQKPQPK